MGFFLSLQNLEVKGFSFLLMLNICHLVSLCLGLSNLFNRGPKGQAVCWIRFFKALVSSYEIAPLILWVGYTGGIRARRTLIRFWEVK